MLKAPLPNEPGNPLISILIFNYEWKHFHQCLDILFSQKILSNLEIIIIDDATTDGSWKTAVEFARKYEGVITLTRNKYVMGPGVNCGEAWRKARGKYAVTLTGDQMVSPEYIDHCVKTMEADPFISFATVHRIIPSCETLPNIKGKPLVSLLVFNYNYGRYLRECLDSALAQTYDNTEICFSDNASTDDSWDIALEYAEKHPGNIFITRNRSNFGSDANFANCFGVARGKYFVEVCSDDALMPDFVKRCVDAMEAHPEAGYVMVNRQIIDADGRPTEEPPFYNQSCLIPGEAQAAVYMVAAVNPSVTQIMYHKTKAARCCALGTLASRWYGTRIMDFNMCCQYPMIYIKDSLMKHRLHSANDSFAAAANLIEVLGPFMLAKQFAEIADQYGFSKASARLPEAIDKLSKLSLRYCARFLTTNKDKEEDAFKYFHLALALNPETRNDSTFKEIEGYWTADAKHKKAIVKKLESTANLVTRKVSYDPPSGFIPLETNPSNEMALS